MKASLVSWLTAAMVILGLAGCARTVVGPPPRVAVARESGSERLVKPARVSADPAGTAAAPSRNAESSVYVTVTPTELAPPVPPAETLSRDEPTAVSNYGRADANRDAYLNQPLDFEPPDGAPVFSPGPMNYVNDSSRGQTVTNSATVVTTHTRSVSTPTVTGGHSTGTSSSTSVRSNSSSH